MSSNVCATYRFDVSNRRWEKRIVFFCLGVGAAMPWLYPLPALAWTFLVITIVVSASLFGFKRSGWMGARRIQQLHTDGGPNWLLSTANGDRIETQLASHTRTYRQWQWLAFASGHVVLVGPGDVAEEDQRRLRIVLRHRSSEPAMLGESVA